VRPPADAIDTLEAVAPPVLELLRGERRGDARVGDGGDGEGEGKGHAGQVAAADEVRRPRRVYTSRYTERPPARLWPWALGTAAVSLAALGGAAGLSAQSHATARDIRGAVHDGATVEHLAARGRREVRGSHVLYGVAGVLAAAAVTLFALDGRVPDLFAGGGGDRSLRPRAGLVAGPGDIGLGLGLVLEAP
jgi:hypothetical protein